MIDKPEVTAKPPGKEPEIIREFKASPETRDALIMAQAWECPFCKRMNGIPEVDVCKCGARREGTKATKG